MRPALVLALLASLPAGAASAACDIASSRSAPTAQAISVGIANDLPRSLDVYWIDHGGGLKFYQNLAPGQRYRQSTYVDHLWVGLDSAGACHGPIKAERDGQDLTFR